MEKAEAKGVKFLLPEDVVVADKVCLRARERTKQNKSTQGITFAL